MLWLIHPLNWQGLTTFLKANLLDHLYELVGIYCLEEAFAGARMGPDPRSWCTRSG
jgi:hypothetical protein